jgi:hypothetical protein
MPIHDVSGRLASNDGGPKVQEVRDARETV